MRMCHFRAQNDPFVLNKIFLVQTIIITFINLLAIFNLQNFEKILQRIQNYDDAPFLDPKWSKSPNQNFSENLLMILVSLIHVYLHSKNQSQILIY